MRRWWLPITCVAVVLCIVAPRDAAPQNPAVYLQLSPTVKAVLRGEMASARRGSIQIRFPPSAPFHQNIFDQQHHYGSDGHSHLFENLLEFCHQGRLEGKKLLNVSFQLRTVCRIDIQLSLSRFSQKLLILHGVHKGPS